MTYAIIAYAAAVAIWIVWLLAVGARERSLRDD